MTFVKQGVVIPRGIPGTLDGKHTAHPAAILLDGKVFLYYDAGDFANCTRVALATSSDGVHFNKLGVVIPLGTGGEFDDVLTMYPGVILLNNKVYLYYTGMNSMYHIGLAVSVDGVHFTKLGVTLPIGPSGDFDDLLSCYPSPLLLDGKIWLYYTGHDGSQYRIGLAISNDGVHFTRSGVVIPLGASGEFDDVTTQHPTFVSLGGRVFLYYASYDGSKTGIGLAISDDGIHFVKHGVVLPAGVGEEFDAKSIYYPSAIVLDGKVWIYYGGLQRDNRVRIGLAISEDGL